MLEQAPPRGAQREEYKRRVCNLAAEPMTFCYADMHPKNFMVDASGSIIIVDFGVACILPASFVLYITRSQRLGFDISKLVEVPGASLENVAALGQANRWITQGSSSFSKLGREEIVGGD